MPAAGNDAAGRVWMRLMACNKLVETRLRNRLRADFDATLPRFDVLAQIDREPRGPTMSELSERLMVTKANITDLFGRLEADGLVSRKRSKKDGRIQHVYLTAKGKNELAEMLKSHNAWLAELMSDLDENDLAALHDILGRLRDSLKAAGERQ